MHALPIRNVPRLRPYRRCLAAVLAANMLRGARQAVPTAAALNITALNSLCAAPTDHMCEAFMLAAAKIKRNAAVVARMHAGHEPDGVAS
jgi:hypothetical protein